MKKMLLLIPFFTLMTGFLCAQKTINDANAEKRSVGSFHGIDVATGIQLVLTPDQSEQVVVSAAAPEYRDRIVTEVVNGILKIHYDSKLASINRRNEAKKLRAYVSYKSIDHLAVTSGAEVNIEGVLQAASLDLKANTGGLVTGEVNITSLNVDQDTGSKIDLTGKAENLEVEGNTGSKFTAYNMQTVSCKVNVSTGAKVSVQVEKQLQVRASTGGAVSYKGDAAIKEIKTNTGGSVSKS